MGISLFTTAKPFRNRARVHQTNALKSWTKLPGDWELILIGDDEGVAEFAAENGFVHFPEVATSSTGAPLVSDLFRIAKETAKHPVIAYANADIILLSDTQRLLQLFETDPAAQRALITARRQELELDQPIDFSNEDWENGLRNELERNGHFDFETALDLFVFKKELLENLPPFAIGRPGWDNWLLAFARSKGAEIIDASNAITMIHPVHDYSHVSGGWLQAWHGQDAQANRALLDLPLTKLSRATTLSLFPDGLKRGYHANDSEEEHKADRKLRFALKLFSQGESESAFSCCIEALSLGGLPIADCPRFAHSPTFQTYLESLLEGGGQGLDLNTLESLSQSAFGDWIRSLPANAFPREFFIWGGGHAGLAMKKCFDTASLQLAGFIDSDPTKSGTYIDDVPVLSPDSLRNDKQANPFVVVASMYRGEIEDSLEAMGFIPLEDFV